MTIVFDKGNNYKDNLSKFVEDSGFHLVGSVKPTEERYARLNRGVGKFTGL